MSIWQKHLFESFKEDLQRKINDRIYVIKYKKQGVDKAKEGVVGIAKTFWENLNLGQAMGESYSYYTEQVKAEINELHREESYFCSLVHIFDQIICQITASRELQCELQALFECFSESFTNLKSQIEVENAG